MCYAEDVSRRWTSWSEAQAGRFLETQKQSAPEEAEEPESEPKERIRTVVKLTEGLRLIAVLIKLFEDTDLNE